MIGDVFELGHGGAVTVARIDIDGYTLADVVSLYDDGPVVWV